MNIRKNIDYTDMYEALDSAMAENMSQVNCITRLARPFVREQKRERRLRLLHI